MKTSILKCKECGAYTLEKKCSCAGKAVNPEPAKFSPQDKYAKYRRKAKENQLEKKGLL